MSYKIQKQRIIKTFSSHQRQRKINFLRTSLINQINSHSLWNSIEQIKQRLQIKNEDYLTNQLQQQLKYDSQMCQLLNQTFWQVLINKSKQFIITKFSLNQQKIIKDFQQNWSLVINSLFFINYYNQSKDEQKQIETFCLPIQKIKYLHRKTFQILQIFSQNNFLCLSLWQSIFQLNNQHFLIIKYIKFFIQKICGELIDNYRNLDNQNFYSLVLCMKYITKFNFQNIRKLQQNKRTTFLQLVIRLAQQPSFQQDKYIQIFQIIVTLMQQLNRQKTNLFVDMNIFIQIGSTINVLSKKADPLILKYLKNLNILMIQSSDFLSLIQKGFNLKNVQKLIHHLNFYVQSFFFSFVSKQRSFQQYESYYLFNQTVIFIGNILALDFKPTSIITQNILRVIANVQINQQHSIFILNLQLKLTQIELVLQDTERFHILIQKMINSYTVQIIKNGTLTFLHFLVIIFQNIESECGRFIFQKISNNFVFKKNLTTIKLLASQSYIDNQLVKTCSDILQIQHLIQSASNT